LRRPSRGSGKWRRATKRPRLDCAERGCGIWPALRCAGLRTRSGAPGNRQTRRRGVIAGRLPPPSADDETDLSATASRARLRRDGPICGTHAGRLAALLVLRESIETLIPATSGRAGRRIARAWCRSARCCEFTWRYTGRDSGRKSVALFVRQPSERRCSRCRSCCRRYTAPPLASEMCLAGWCRLLPR
jgi:hypothetical protein